MQVLVLGGSGFIGCHVVRAFAGAGHDVRVYGRSTVPPHMREPGVEYLTGDLADTPALSPALAGVEAVCHLVSATIPATAERDPIADVQGNLVGTLGLLAEMQRRGIARLIYMSSGGMVYGPASVVPTPETHPLNPSSSYGIVKAAIEHFLFRQSRFGLVPVVLRTANAYGPSPTRPGILGFVNTVLHRLATDTPLELWGDGTVVRDFLHVRDLADLALRALSTDGPMTLNAGSGRGTSLREVIALAEQVTGRRLALVTRPAREVDMPVSVLDIGRARDLLGWSPRVSLAEGLAETWDWMQAEVSRERGS